MSSVAITTSSLPQTGSDTYLPYGSITQDPPGHSASGKRFVLSGEGRDLLNYAHSLVSIEQEMAAHFNDKGPPSGTLCIGLLESISACEYAESIVVFMKQYPAVRLEVVTATTLRLMDMLEKGYNYRYAFEEELSRRGLTISDTLEIGSTNILIACTQNGLGSSLLPEYNLTEKSLKSRIAILRVSDYTLEMDLQNGEITNMQNRPKIIPNRPKPM